MLPTSTGQPCVILDVGANVSPKPEHLFQYGVMGAIYAETIPFNETRDYVKKVLANAMFYQAQLGLPYVALRERLGVVAPRGSSGASSEVAAIPAGDRPKEAP